MKAEFIEWEDIKKDCNFQKKIITMVIFME